MKNIISHSIKLFLIILSWVSANAQWEQVIMDTSMYVYVRSLSTYNNTLYVGTSNGLYVTSDNGASWDKVFPGSVEALAVRGNASGGKNIYIGKTNGVWLSTDNGENWTNTSEESFPEDIQCFAFTDDFLFAGTLDGTAVSDFDCTDWVSAADLGLTNDNIKALIYHNGYLFAGTSCGGVFRSDDNATSWEHVMNSGCIHALAHAGYYLFAGNGSYGVYRSLNNGLSWMEVNEGLTGDMSTWVNAFAVYGVHIFLGVEGGGGIYLSTNYGETWERVDEGTMCHSVYELIICNSYLYAGSDGCPYIYRRPLSDMTFIENSSHASPDHFYLKQNYPNPFNSFTNISYSIPKSDFVSLKIYDMSGREIQTLVNELQEANTYSVNIDASKLSSGIYFYKLKVGSDFRDTKKMLLLR